jgi:hypothetical protein
VNQARFVRGFATRARELGIYYNLIEAIDQPWKKTAEGTVGGHWGILDEWRAPKFSLTGPVSDWPDWRSQFLATGAIILAACLAGLRRRLSWKQWIGWSFLAFALGLSLVFQWDFVSATRNSDWGWIGGGVAAAVTIWAAVLISSMLAGTGPAAMTSLADLGRALRTPRAIIRSIPQKHAAFFAMVMIAAAWVSLTLAFAARYRDIPLAQFLLPAVAIAAWLVRYRPAIQHDHREEALLATIIVVGGVMQAEFRNPESLGWLGISVLLAAPWLHSLGAELGRLRRLADDRGMARTRD